jgi:ABC-type amino acid transport system permease subunit
MASRMSVSNRQAMFHTILPHALGNMILSLDDWFESLIKNTLLAYAFTTLSLWLKRRLAYAKAI